MSADDLRLDMDELLDELAEMRLRIRDQARVEKCLDNAVAILTRMHSHVMISDIHGAEKERDQWREANIASEAHAVELVGKLDDAERERDEWKKAATKNIKMLHAAQDRIAELEAALRQIADHYRHGADMMDIARAALSAPAQPVKEHCPRRLMGETLAPHAPCDTGDHSRDAQPATAAAKCNECGKVIEEENAYAQDGHMFHADCWRKRTAPSSHAHDCAIAMNARHECTCVAAPPSPAAREANDPDTEDLMLGPCFDCECTTVDNGLCPCLCHPDNQPDAKAVISSNREDEIERLRNALDLIRTWGNAGHSQAVEMQQVAAEVLHPGKFPTPEHIRTQMKAWKEEK